VVFFVVPGGSNSLKHCKQLLSEALHMVAVPEELIALLAFKKLVLALIHPGRDVFLHIFWAHFNQHTVALKTAGHKPAFVESHGILCRHFRELFCRML
jgi:hypothetical protein